MKAFTIPQPGAEVVEIEQDDPHPVGSEVVLEVRYAGVCHTDAHLRDGGFDAGSIGKLDMAARGMPFPAVLGHEIVGDVVAVGPDVTTVGVGDRRLVFPWIGCDECSRCASGRENACRRPRSLGVFAWGGFATHVRVAHERFLLDIDGVDPAWAATLACSGVTSYATVQALPPLDAQDVVAVIGAGGVGLTAIALLRELTPAVVVAVDVSDDRLEIARRMGASLTVNSTRLAPGESLAQVVDGPVTAVCDFVNSTATAALAFGSIDKEGTILAVGMFGGEVIVPNAVLASRGITIRGISAGSLGQLRQLVELARTVELPSVPINTAVLDARAVEDGLHDLVHGRTRGRLVLTA